MSDSTLIAVISKQGEHLLKDLVGGHPMLCVSPENSKKLEQNQTDKPTSFLQKQGELVIDALSTSHLDKKNFLVVLSQAFVGRRLLEAPKSTDEAMRHIHLLSGRRHRIVTGVILLYNTKVHKRIVETCVQFKLLTPSEKSYYVENKLWHSEKVGSYDPLGYEGKWIKGIQGSASNLFGCPLYELNALLKGAGLL